MCRILQTVVIWLLLLTTSVPAGFAQLIDGSVIRQQKTAPGHRGPPGGFELSDPPQPNRIRNRLPKRIGALHRPFTEAGELDGPLSALCRSGRFMELAQGRWTLRFVDPDGARSAMLGVARVGNNLIDLTAAAEPGQIYLFRNSGASRCQVYRWTEAWPPEQG
mgnify:FL=1